MSNAPTLAQVEELITFMEAHRELALGHFNRTKEGKALSKRLWIQCANILNSVSAECTTRDASGWRQYYNEYKSKLLKKIKTMKQEKFATGGGEYANINLTPLQDRLYALLGRNVGEPLPDVRQDPFRPRNETAQGDINEAGPSSQQASEASPSRQHWPTHQNLPQSAQSSPQPPQLLALPRQRQIMPPQLPPLDTIQPSASPPLQPASRFPNSVSPSPRMDVTEDWATLLRAEAESAEQPRRRRRAMEPSATRQRRRLYEESAPRCNEPTLETSLEEAQRRLAETQSVNAAANLARARATEALATAIATGLEKMAAAINNLAAATSRSRNRSRRLTSSSSEDD